MKGKQKTYEMLLNRFVDIEKEGPVMVGTERIEILWPAKHYNFVTTLRQVRANILG
jgi:hypothetical protein